MNFKKNKSVLVIGDIILDSYIFGNINRISPEAPVPVFNYSNTEYRLGGAGNVAANLKQLFNEVHILSIVGDDTNGKILFNLLTDKNVNTDKLIISNKFSTINKSRFISSNQQTFRLDQENIEVENFTIPEYINDIKEYIHNFEAIVISDYGKGFLNKISLNFIIDIANKFNIKVFCDLKGSDPYKYSGAFFLKPNKKELFELTDKFVINVEKSNEIEYRIKLLSSLTKASVILVTLGKEGMILYSDNSFFHINEKSKAVYDVTGAGDTVISYFVGFFLYSKDALISSRMANKAANIKISKMGTSIVELNELFHDLSISNYDYKIINEDFINDNQHLFNNKKIVFTNGVFDILHLGHLEYLQRSKLLGEILIVAINSDTSVKRLKGSQRPFNNQKDRALFLSYLSFVDYVIIFDEDTPLNLITLIKPHYLTKGSDYVLADVVGKNIVETNGGSVVLIPLKKGYSTSKILNGNK